MSRPVKHDNQTRGRQDLRVLRSPRFAVSPTGEAAEESAGACDDRRTQPSRSRKSSDSAPSLLSVARAILDARR